MMPPTLRSGLAIGALLLLRAPSARAEETAPTAGPAIAAGAPASQGLVEPPKASALSVTPTGYVETYWSHAFGRPSNGIVNYRGFDNRHQTFTLSALAAGAGWEAGPVSGKVILQVGSTPSTYWMSEPSHPGATGANGSNAELWKYVQEAYVGYRAPLGHGLLVHAGIFGSPIGFECFAVKDNWNWSRSNLFVGLPFYHTGVRVAYPLTEHLSVSAAVMNGWNSVVDSNGDKSVTANVRYERPGLTAQALYMGGVERPTGSPEGPYWRHLVDGYAIVDLSRTLALAAEANAGFEPNRLGASRWWAGALYARVRATDWLFLAARGDRVQEHLATDSTGRSSTALFFGGAEWISSATFTAEVRPHSQLSFRIEGRHDMAEAPLFFSGDVAGNGDTVPYAPNARHQTTILAGATAWF